MKLLFCNISRFVLGGIQISRLGLATAACLVRYWTSAQPLSLARRVKAWPGVHSRKVNFYSKNPTVLRQTLNSRALHSLPWIYHSFKHPWSLLLFLFGRKAVYQTGISKYLPQIFSGMSWGQIRGMYQLFLLSEFRDFHQTVDKFILEILFKL